MQEEDEEPEPKFPKVVTTPGTENFPEDLNQSNDDDEPLTLFTSTTLPPELGGAGDAPGGLGPGMPGMGPMSAGFATR